MFFKRSERFYNRIVTQKGFETIFTRIVKKENKLPVTDTALYLFTM